MNLMHGFTLLLKHNKDGSYATRSARHKVLTLVDKELRAGGFKQLTLENIKGRHVRFLVDSWHQKGLSAATIKNRLSHIRWAFERAGRGQCIEKDNAAYGVANRVFLNNAVNKAKELDAQKLSQISDKGLQLSLCLQAAFGLRREECLKFRPSVAIKEGQLELAGSWTKGGKPRTIPIRTDEQRELLKEVAAHAGRGSMIPADKNYYQHLKLYENECARVGLNNNHGLRHEYAQSRYRELTGWDAPKAGGPTSKELTKEQRAADYAARMTISVELGHEREAITVAYLGR